MSTAAYSTAIQRTSLLRPILAGGAIAGTLDLIAAFMTYGPLVPRGIAAGLIGRPAAIHGGAFVWVLGVILHYFIAFSAATVYCLASRRLEFLWDHFVVCGLLYGMAFYLVMTLVVLPLCALHLTGPFQLRDLLQGLAVHMVIIGLPISSSLRKLSA
jgi:hypothetical protein